MRHFRRFGHWYDLDKIRSTFTLDLKVENFVDDEEFENEWPNWYNDLTNEPSDSFELIALAIHTIIYDEIKRQNINYQLKKIFVR